ncbi:hypothetical protein A4V15_00360 [Pseudomonas oryzihabitans]|uniref:Uncharacterized protein n=1 Tax=Pseudomonas oryzihabitans TaxID=47885 RepID=A0A178LNK6_9PSED|nr:hypothetical protein A4V15_00360 [Pseudomonas oryzihabitans]
MRLQVLEDIHHGLFAVMVIEDFIAQPFRVRVIQPAQEFSFEFCIDSHEFSSYGCTGYDKRGDDQCLVRSYRTSSRSAENVLIMQAVPRVTETPIDLVWTAISLNNLTKLSSCGTRS